MRVVFIAFKDYANAVHNISDALNRYGITSNVIMTKERTTEGFTARYDVPFWTKKDKAMSLIEAADIYMICESGCVNYKGKLDFSFLKKIGFKRNKPTGMVVNSSVYYKNPEWFERVRQLADFYVALTINYPISGLKLGLQPVDENIFRVKTDYNTTELVAAAAPGWLRQKDAKGVSYIESKIENFRCIMASEFQDYPTILDRIFGCDIFTHGIYYAYGYTLIEAGMMGIPCFGSILDKDKKHVLLGGEYPVYDIGRRGEKIPEMLEFFSYEKNREIYGKKMRKWALKYHSQHACYKVYKKIFEEVL